LHSATRRSAAFDDVAVAPPGPAAPAPAAPAPPPLASAPVSPASRPAPRFRLDPDATALTLILAIPVAATVYGLPYYLMSSGERMRSPLHALLKPSGSLGLAFGVVGLALFLFLWLYPLRKQVKWLAWTGKVGSWMRVHVVAGLAVPVLVAVHAGWRFDGVIGLGYLAMFTVSLSGLIGRYLYVHIPRSRDGLELTRSEVENERRALVTRIAAATGLEPREVDRSLTVDPRPYDGLDPLRTLVRMAQDDWARARAIERLKREWSAPRAGARPPSATALAEAMRLAKREMAMAQQVRMLEATRTVFGYWHVAHRPFAVTSLLAVILHVVVALLVGAVGF
jgi:hypothetical protein